MGKIIHFFERIYKYSFIFMGIPIIVITIVEVLNVLGRKFLSPFPCAVETIETFLILCTYLGVSAVAAEGGHVNVVLATRNLPESVQGFIDGAANLFGACIFGIWAWAAWVAAMKSLAIWEMKIGVFRYPIYPFRIAFALGLTLLAIQLLCNAVRFVAAAAGHPIEAVETHEKKILLEV